VLAEPEAAALDEQLFRSDDVLSRLEDEQQMLIEDSARGLLSAEEEARFREQCARSPRLSRDAAEVKALLAGLGQRGPSARMARTTTLWQRFFVILSPALAVALCVVAFLYVHERHVNGDLLARPDAPAEALAPVQPVAGGQPVVAFLAANVVRGGASLPQVVVPSAAAAVELQVEVRGAGVGSGAWSVNLSNAGHPVWMSARVPLRQLGAETFLDLHLDADVLAPGAYELQLASQADPGSVQTRQFIVARGK